MVSVQQFARISEALTGEENLDRRLAREYLARLKAAP
jgi:hypothetical protein